MRIRGEWARLYTGLKGFGIMGTGSTYYLPLSVALLLECIAQRRSDDERFLTSLVQAARLCGSTVLEGMVTVRSQGFLSYLIAVRAMDAQS